MEAGEKLITNSVKSIQQSNGDKARRYAKSQILDTTSPSLSISAVVPNVVSQDVVSRVSDSLLNHCKTIKFVVRKVP